MNPLTKHTQEQGVTYWEHWDFAMSIAYRLLISVMAFAMHAMLPFKSIEPRYDLEATAAYLEERNHWIEDTGKTKDSRSNEGFAGSDPVVV